MVWTLHSTGDVRFNYGRQHERALFNQLDAGGYSIDVEGLTFTDGTTFEPFTMTG